MLKMSKVRFSIVCLLSKLGKRKVMQLTEMSVRFS
jgi:hypothetical protein